MIKLLNICFRYRTKIIIEDGSIMINDQQIVGLSGVSGSGKSSLLLEMLFMTHHAHMYYEIDGKSVDEMSQKEKDDLKRCYFSVVTQDIQFIESMSAIENIKFFGQLNHLDFDEQKVYQYLDKLSLNIDLETQVAHLSGGERQRLSIICALMKNTPVILMDEPTAYLDYENRQLFIHLLKILKNEFHKTVFIATHDSLVIENCDSLYEIKDKRISCLKYKEGRQDRKLKVSALSPSLLKLFFQKEYLKKRNIYRVLQVFLTVILCSSCYFTLYLTNYQKQIEDQFRHYTSHQIVIDVGENISNKQINKLKLIEYIEDVKKFTFFITDDFYIVCPYLSNDYFTNHIYSSESQRSHIYANYEIYKNNMDSMIKLNIHQSEILFDIQYYLDPLFEDYRYMTSVAKVIYVPYEQYLNLIEQFNIDQQITTYCLIQIDLSAHYENVLNDLSDNIKSMQIVGNSNLVKIIQTMNQFKDFSHNIVKLLFLLLILSVFILKFIDIYQTKHTHFILEVNGIPHKDIMKLVLKKEWKLISIPLCISFIIVLVLYYFLNYLTGQVVFYALLYLMGVVIIIIIFTLVTYTLVPLKYIH